MKYKTHTRALSWLLTLVMLLGMVPGLSMTALATDSPWESGDCTVTLDGTTLTVSKKTGDGNGKMADYSDEYGDNRVPWESVKGSVTSVVISDGVTGIGNYAFNNFGSIASLSIANTVTNIGEYAFNNCGSLLDITIPASVTSIGASALYTSTPGRKVTFVRPTSESTLTVADYAVYYSASLAYSGDGNYTLFDGDSEIEFAGSYNGDKLNGKNLTWKLPIFSITDNSVHGSVTASVGGSNVTRAEVGNTVTLTVTPASGYQFKSIKVSSPKDSPESFSDLVALMGSAEFAGRYDTTGYICKVENGGFAVYNGTTKITEAVSSNVTNFAFSDMAGYIYCGDVSWQFTVSSGKITYISANNGNWLFDGGGESNGELVPDELILTTVTAGSKYTFTMPKKSVTVTAEFEESTHEHNFTYSASGAIITATCSVDGCPLPEVNGKHTATLTIVAPQHTNVGDGKSAEATITDANSIKGSATVSYYAATKSGTTYTKTGNALASAPTAAGDYVAEITVGGVTASVGYTISKTAQAAPTGFKSTPAETPYANGSINDGDPAIDKTNLQVSNDGGKTWTDVAQFPVSGKPGVYQFKYKETDALSESPVTSVLLEAANELREVKITSNQTDANIYKDGETNTLTAVTNTNVTGLTLEYAWYREGVAETVGSSNTYALQAEDVDKKLTVVVTDKTTGAAEPYTSVSTATPVIVTVAPTTYQITGNVKVPTADGATTYNNVASANVELRQGNTVFATATTDSSGNYTFTSVPNGEYNIVVTDANGTTKTEYVKVENGNQTINVTMPFYKVSSKVDVKGETPAAVVAGLDDAAANSLTDAEKTSGVTTTMTMEIESTNDLTATAESDLTDEQKQVKVEQQAIKAWNTGTNKSDALDFIDMSVYKRTQKTGESAQVEDVHNLSKVLEILLPYTTANRSFNIFRYHGTAATKFTRLTTRPTGSFADGEFFVGDGFIAIYASGFSTYAIGYSASSSFDPAPVPATTPAYSSGDSSSDSDDYINRVVKSDNGTVSVNRDTASNGEKVTITVKPNAGYAADTVTVTGSGGRSASVTKVNNTTYTYIQPGMDVKINVTFKPVSGMGEANCPLSAFTDADAKAWYHDGVHWALENGVMNGVASDKFNPGGDTSRAMVVTMLWRLEGSPAYVGKNEFDDVKSEDWYAQAVRWASAEGIVTGYEQDGVKVFNPNGAVTREQLATMLYRYAQHKGQGFTGLWSFPLDYPDAANVSEWAYEAMCWMTMNGVINGMDGKLAPAASATRAQVASMFMRYCTSAAK